MFTRRGRAEGPPQRSSIEKHTWPSTHSKTSDSPNEKRERPMKERAMSAWLVAAQRKRHSKSAEGGADHADEEEEGRRRSWGLHIPLPSTPAPITISQNRTPGWDTPWSARRSHSLNGSVGGGSNIGSRTGSFANGNGSVHLANAEKHSKWYHRRKRLRAFILTNNYVPLVGCLFSQYMLCFDEIFSLKLFRVINITLTTAALAVAIRIRRKEQVFNIMGAVGSSPYVSHL